MRATLLAVLAFTGLAAPSHAETVEPTLVVAIHTQPADRAALRTILEQRQVARLKRWQSEGVITGYRLMFTRWADSGVWDAMEVLSFKDSSGLARWQMIERRSAGGLDPAALNLVTAIETTPTSVVRHGGKAPAAAQAILVIPYTALVPPPEYLRYLDGYTIPQFNGWIEDGALADYRILTATYPAGRDWNALIELRYASDAALARREEVVTAVRARLALDPAWKAISDAKKEVRSEGRIAVADLISGSEVP